MTLGQCEGEVRAGPGFSCQVTVAVFPGSLWGAGFHTHPPVPAPLWKAASPQGERGPGAGCEPRLPSPVPGALWLLLSRSHSLQGFVLLQRCQFLHLPLEEGPRWQMTMAWPLLPRVSSSPAESVPPLTQMSSFPPKKRFYGKTQRNPIFGSI